jgi:hypothetical protein
VGVAAGLLAFAIPSMAGTTASAAKSGTPQTLQTVTKKGTTTLKTIGSGSASGSPSATGEYTTGPTVDQTVPKSGLGGNTRLPANHVPTPASNAITTSTNASGFSGLTHKDQRTSGTGIYTNTNFSLEPPDQGLCTNGTYVMEGVNNALRIFNTNGTAATATVSTSQFFQETPQITRSNPIVYGEFISDPKCLYDPANGGHWIVSELAFGQDPSTGNFEGPSHEDLAVSKTSDPTGDYWLYQFDTTNGDGTLANHPGCPCFGDQPLIGADQYGFYVSTNEYPINGPGFNGSQLYAMNKASLESGSLGTVDYIDVGATVPVPATDTGALWYTLQPATVPPGGSYATGNNGTEYFLSSLQFFSNVPLDNRIAVWALTNTSSLTTATPSLNLSHQVITSEVYGQPASAQQKPGSTPFGNAGITYFYGFKPAPEELLAGNDDRMNQVVYANGELWSGVNTVLQPPNGPTRVGIAYFIVTPSVDNTGQVSGTIANQGYVSANQENVLFPSIGVNSSGKGVMTFTLVGPDYYPSAAYAPIDATNGAGAIHIAAAGVGPDDGFTGYYPFGTNRTARWGDYSAAVAAPDGSIWFATEYIPDSCTNDLPGGDCTNRTLLANWGTFVGNITL